MEVDKKRKATLKGLTCILKILNTSADILQCRADISVYSSGAIYMYIGL